MSRLPTMKTNPALLALLERAAGHKVTPREIWQQRVSFVYGQLMGKPGITREMVEARAVREYGPCPEEPA